MGIVVTRWGHSCVRVGEVCIDPGAFSATRQALDGARIVLVTHDHIDHLDVAAVVAAAVAGAAVHGPASVVDALVAAGAPQPALHTVVAGDRLAVGGLDVAVLGEWHALIHADVPRALNVGYLIDGLLLHPGDAYVAPVPDLDTLLVPLGAPWLRLGDVVDWVRAQHPAHLVAIHDGTLSAPGAANACTLIERLCGLPVRVLAPGESVTVG